jgi:two-component system, OmpR family, phosphate regulon sensor histidine kinase PhoR
MTSFFSQLTFRTKLLASHVGLVAVVVAIAILLLNRALGADLAAQLDRRLEEQARGAAVWVGEGRRHPDKLAGRIALIVSATVTIFDKDGKVLGDSAGTPPPAEMPPEVLAAQRGDVAGRASRVTEAGEEMHFVAVAAGDGLILRLGAPLSGINATVREMQRQLVGASGIALAFALALGFLAARVASEPLRAMTASATRLMRGEYDLEPLPDSPDEFGLLSRTLSSLAAELKSKIGDLTRERDRLSAILAGMAEGVLVTDEEGKVLLANPAAATILGAELPAGAALADVVAAPELLGFIEAAKASGEIREDEIETHDRGDRTIALYVRPLGTASLRSPRGLVTVLRDLTRIVHLVELRRDFVANVSHELRTPVTSIQGYAETLLRGTTDAATTRQFLEIIHRQAQRIGQLVTGLLSLSELEARPEGEAIREPVLLTAVGGAVKDTVRTRLVEAETRLTLEIPEDLRVLGDPSGVEQVLLNLVDNAIKYGKRDGAEGRVVVSAKREAKAALLSVADTGPGIEARHLPRLFERFYRVDAGRSRDRGGSGLGLAIVKHLVEAMGGRIDVKSELGVGTTFEVRLPLAA